MRRSLFRDTVGVGVTPTPPLPHLSPAVLGADSPGLPTRESAFSFYSLVKITRAFEHDLHPRRYQYDAALHNPETF